MQQKFVLLAALICGVLAALMAHAWIKGKDAAYADKYNELYAKTREVEVLVAAKSLPRGTVLQFTDVGTLSVPRALASHAVMPEDYNRVLGLKTLYEIDARFPILWSHIEGGKKGTKGLSGDIRSGMRAVSIPVSGASAVSGLVLPNDTVDVLGSFVFGATDDPKASELVTLTVLQNVTVLATGMETAKSMSSGQHAGGYSTVTLEVTPREAEVLVFAQQMKGRLSLTLRNPSDVYYEREMPRVDFQKIESELKTLNDYRQTTIRSGAL